jgi:hypothetical protein
MNINEIVFEINEKNRVIDKIIISTRVKIDSSNTIIKNKTIVIIKYKSCIK